MIPFKYLLFLFCFLQSWLDSRKCSKSQKIHYYEKETFHLGSDGIIHFTETHEKKMYDNFCVDLSMNDELIQRSSDYDYSYEHGEHEDDPEYEYTEAEYADDYPEDYPEEYKDNTRDSVNGSAKCTSPLEAVGKHWMVAIFCDYGFVDIRKCCDKHENLNLRCI